MTLVERLLEENGAVTRPLRPLREEAAAEIERLTLRLSEVQKWIPVSERLPAPEQRVLVYKASVTAPCDYDTDRASRYFSSGFVHNENVTHWMPLPEAPK